MSVNCMHCLFRNRTGSDLLCDRCRVVERARNVSNEASPLPPRMQSVLCDLLGVYDQVFEESTLRKVEIEDAKKLIVEQGRIIRGYLKEIGDFERREDAAKQVIASSKCWQANRISACELPDGFSVWASDDNGDHHTVNFRVGDVGVPTKTAAHVIALAYARSLAKQFGAGGVNWRTKREVANAK